ncbi:XrtA-associated tyrosine autokinase [Piscinibacter sp.]|uniref:XrtA-associated tyrosine autokinase n=1 Tax=Piscinibacter sp. TaxID=1903157 RepID=UPI002C9B9FEA|nr:XrtA-associated tyrosine autokinase [Albitalea sp.]HUG25783.1 XrtA-associated tyrosine autokinase [Albitalea sp.]
MSIIEQATRRLEELRRSGIELPPRTEAAAPGAEAGESLPARAVRRLQEAGAATPGTARERQAEVREFAPTGHGPASAQSKHTCIDLDRLASMGYLTPGTPRAQIADEFRVIKRPMLMNILGKSAAPVERANLIMVTSSLPGEGKTFVAINLAVSMAMELDKTVLLVDADVSRPSVLTRLGLTPAPGLLDVLGDPSKDLSDVLLRTNIDTLSVLPAGAPNGRATELLASDGMNQLIEEMATRYADRILIFDAPPLLPSTESRVLATHMGQIVVVVEADRTPQKAVAQAMSTLEACPVVLPLLNKANHSEVGFYYGYYGPVEG